MEYDYSYDKERSDVTRRRCLNALDERKFGEMTEFELEFVDKTIHVRNFTHGERTVIDVMLDRYGSRLEY